MFVIEATYAALTIGMSGAQHVMVMWCRPHPQFLGMGKAISVPAVDAPWPVALWCMRIGGEFLFRIEQLLNLTYLEIWREQDSIWEITS